MRVLLTGMSGTGKSTVVHELRRRDFAAYDADDDGFTEPAGDGTWRWRTSAVTALLDRHDAGLVFFAGCSDEQAQFAWDRQVLLTVPEVVLLERLKSRTSNDFGKSKSDRERVLLDLREVEPLLRRVADRVVSTDRPLADVVDEVLAAALGKRRA
ncbi:shikimate kinase [Motilibacter peucedani]|uniref:Shikimate kinase n=1 Tax=Motilibacter peucedani TaxID=598650 RepID=A0A420XQX4_9ACTN|nr:AAA family ATPase [Motilibacter peucedani]RKS75645.1 shikimate kinase [Motilibacter peucedani]